MNGITDKMLKMTNVIDKWLLVWLVVRSFKVSDGQVVSFANGTEFDHETGMKILSLFYMFTLGTFELLVGRVESWVLGWMTDWLIAWLIDISRLRITYW